MKNILSFYREIPFSQLILMREGTIDRDYQIKINQAIQDRIKGKPTFCQLFDMKEAASETELVPEIDAEIIAKASEYFKPEKEEKGFRKAFRREKNDEYQRK